MTQGQGDPLSWVSIAVGLIPANVIVVVSALIIYRQRRWRDQKILDKPAAMPPEHLLMPPKTVKDMIADDEGYVNPSEIVVARRTRRTYVAWAASLTTPPSDPDNEFAAVLIRRLDRGFSISVRPGIQFRTGSRVWGKYAPVTQILQAITSVPSSEGTDASLSGR